MPPRPRTAPVEVSDATRAKALAVHERLCVEYGCPIAYFHDLDPLSELISSLLSHRTKNRDSGRAFRQLRARFPTWAAVRDAPTAEVQAAIAPATWPEQKAPRIQAILREIGERLTARGAHAAGNVAAANPRGDDALGDDALGDDALGDDALDFLADLPVPEARAWLESLAGVGPKTSAAVLSFSRLRRPALPVDSHHHRVAVRLGLIPASVEVGPAHAWLEAQLPSNWDAQQVYDNHEVLMLHGQHVCHWREPACARCVVLDLCPTGQARLGTTAITAAAGVTSSAAAPAERGLPAQVPPPRTARGRRTDSRPPRRTPQEQLEMSVHPHPNAAPGPDRGDHDPEGGKQAAERPERGRSQGGPGAHGRGHDGLEGRTDEIAVDTGDDPQLRRAGAGRDEAPDPRAFRENAEGRMGGPGWGSEGAGGSSVDRRPGE